MHVGFWRNMCWPRPFVYPDRKAAMAPMVIMANNGWRRNNLLGAHHFAPDGTQLNVAGELMVRWILTQAPMHRRNVFIERAENPEVTSHRIEAVQRYASLVLPEGGFSVVDTHIVAEGRPAADVDATNVAFREAAPVPELPDPSEGTSVSE
jgi:hypothetical protein